MNLMEITVFAFVLLPSPEPMRCVLDRPDLTACSSGNYAVVNDGRIVFANGVTVHKEGDGRLWFDNGISTFVDTAGWIRFSNGVAARRDGAGGIAFNSGFFCRYVDAQTVDCVQKPS